MRPLRVREPTLADGSRSAGRWTGRPTDAVSLAFLGYFDDGFDLVASGINYGANLGDDITYSGTVSAAMEAVINDCPAFAISQEYTEHPDFALAPVAALVARQHPRAGPRARRAAQRERARRSSIAVRGRRDHPHGQAHLPGPAHRAARPARRPVLLDRRTAAVGQPRPGTDFHAVVNGRIAVTPIQLDLTGRRLMRQLQDWDWSLEPVVEAGLPPAASGGPTGAADAAEEARIAEESLLERR